jgi:hypothetical protein
MESVQGNTGKEGEQSIERHTVRRNIARQGLGGNIVRLRCEV